LKATRQTVRNVKILDKYCIIKSPHYIMHITSADFKTKKEYAG